MRSTTPRLGYKAGDTARANDQLKATIDPLLAQKSSSARTFFGLSVTAGTPFTISHGLGRAYTGYEVTRQSSGTGYVLVQEGTNTTPNVTLTLVPTATGTISVKVY